MYKIIEKEQEPSGQWRIRVVVSADESIFLWFPIEPDQENVDRIIEEQLQQRISNNLEIEPLP